MNYYTTWHGYIEKWPGPKLFQRFESLDYDEISEFVGYRVSPINRIVNDKSGDKQRNIPIEQVMGEVSKTKSYPALQAYCEKFGYKC